MSLSSKVGAEPPQSLRLQSLKPAVPKGTHRQSRASDSWLYAVGRCQNKPAPASEKRGGLFWCPFKPFLEQSPQETTQSTSTHNASKSQRPGQTVEADVQLLAQPASPGLFKPGVNEFQIQQFTFPLQKVSQFGPWKLPLLDPKMELEETLREDQMRRS